MQGESSVWEPHPQRKIFEEWEGKKVSMRVFVEKNVERASGGRKKRNSTTQQRRK